MECDACGSRNVTRREIEGHLLWECNLCSNMQGDDIAVRRIEELRRGRERGLDDEVIPLVTALENAGAFHVEQASAEPPQILLTLSHPEDSRPIERLLRSVEMANRQTSARWLIELSLQHGVVYILRPRFWRPPHELTPTDIARSKNDLAILAKQVRRDISLSWWKS